MPAFKFCYPGPCGRPPYPHLLCFFSLWTGSPVQSTDTLVVGVPLFFSCRTEGVHPVLPLSSPCNLCGPSRTAAPFECAVSYWELVTPGATPSRSLLLLLRPSGFRSFGGASSGSGGTAWPSNTCSLCKEAHLDFCLVLSWFFF